MNEPSIIDCTLIDADRNGAADCLVLDEFGELGCINPVSGQWIWHIIDRTVHTTELLSFPLVLPDLDRDGVNDLLVTSTRSGGTGAGGNQSAFNQLNIVSGATGATLGNRYTVEECSFIHKFQLDRLNNVAFNCIRNDTEMQLVKPLAALYRLITNREQESNIVASATPIAQHKFYGQRRDTMVQRNIYSVSGKQLIVENNGKCPDSCNVTVQLIEQRDGKEHIIRNFNGSRMYGMVPALLSFNGSAGGKVAVHGFVIKFWEWGVNETDMQVQLAERSRRSTTASNGEFNRFHDVLQRSGSWTFPLNDGGRPKRGTGHNSSSASGIFKSKIRRIKETVVLIVFNSTDTRIENTSQSNIVQLCRDDDGATGTGGEVACQPDLNYQENSVLIADLDADGSQELVTYYSTFVNTGDDTKMEWKLNTYVQLLRLEAELPKLYLLPTDGGVETTN